MNWYFIFAVVVIGFGSIPKGYDEGGFSAAVGLPSFQKAFHLLPSEWKNNPTGLADRTANITSFGVLGATFGSIVALALTDRLGRLRTWQLFMVWWIIGNLMQVFSSGVLGLMLFARLFTGMAAGGGTVVVPLYLSEIARPKSRGAVVSVYIVVNLVALLSGFFINYGASVRLSDTPLQYRLVIAIPLIPVGLALIASFRLHDTPSWLISRNRCDEARKAMRLLRQGDDEASLTAAMDHIVFSIESRNYEMQGVSNLSAIKEIATNQSYRKRFLLSIFFVTVAQWTGGNGVTYYIPQIFEYAGIPDSGTQLITSGVYGVTKLVVSVIFALFLIDVFGRRRCTLTGIVLQAAAHIYLAVYVGDKSLGNSKQASDAAIAAVYVYAVGWSVGLCTVQYLYSSEIFPVRVRNVAYASVMTLHWLFQFGIVRATGPMLVAWHGWGAFVFWASICVVGFVGIGICAPETKGVPIENMDLLFAGKWYCGWRAKVPLVSTHAAHVSDKQEGQYVEERVEQA